MKVSLKTAFSILDGRLSTKIDDVYKMLNFVFDENFMTHQLSSAINKLKEVNPKWFQDGVDIINDIKRTNSTDDFTELMQIIKKEFPTYKLELGKIDAKIEFTDGLV